MDWHLYVEGLAVLAVTVISKSTHANVRQGGALGHDVAMGRGLSYRLRLMSGPFDKLNLYVLL